MIEMLNQKYKELLTLKEEVKKQEDAFLKELSQNNLYLKSGKILKNEEIYAVEYDLLYYDSYISEKGSLIQRYKGLVEVSYSKAQLIHILLDTLANKKFDPEQFEWILNLIEEEQKTAKNLDYLLEEGKRVFLSANQEEILEFISEAVPFLFIRGIEPYSFDTPDEHVFYNFLSNPSDLAYDETLNFYYFKRKEENYNQGELNRDSYFKIIKTTKENKSIGKYTQEEYID